MEKRGLITTINGEVQTNKTTNTLSGIPENYDENRNVDINDPSIEVEFNQGVKLTFLDLIEVTETGEVKLQDTYVQIVDDNFQPLTDVLEVTNGRVNLPEPLVIKTPVHVVFLSSPSTNLTVKLETHGCIHPGKYNLVLFAQLSKG